MLPNDFSWRRILQLVRDAKEVIWLNELSLHDVFAVLWEARAGNAVQRYVTEDCKDIFLEKKFVLDDCGGVDGDGSKGVGPDGNTRLLNE